MTPKHWLHVDADGTVPPELSGYQGVVCVSGMDGTDNRGGSFQAVLGSHKRDFDDFFRDMWSNKGSLAPLPEAGGYMLVPRRHEMRTRMSRVVAPDRSLLIWKNELFHYCNSPNCSGRFRFAQYVNFHPAERVSEETRRERRDAFAEGIGSTHRVDVFRPSSGPCPDFVRPKLTGRQRAFL